MKMTFDVLDHHDGIIDDQADRKHNRKQRKQVDGEARHQHQEDGTDQRYRDCDHRNQD